MREVDDTSAAEKTALLETILEAIPDAVLVVSDEGRVTYANSRFAFMWGLSPPRLATADVAAVGEHIRGQLQAPDTLAELFAADEGGSETLLRCTDGRFIERSSQPQVLAGRTIGSVHRFRDITEAVRATLAEDERRFLRMVATVPGMVFQFCLRPDGSFDFLFASEGCREIYGLSPEEIVADASRILSVVHPEELDEFQRSIGASAATMSPWIWNGRVVLPDGRIKWLEGASRPTPGKNGEVVWDGMLMDVTQRKLAEQAAIRVRLQQEVIAAQAATLSRLSTPLVPITDEIMVMPLVGQIDDTRARAVLSVLLEGVARNRVRHLILDITGVSEVDRQVAAALLEAAQAVKLLGAQVVLTGIRPEVAQILVALDVDLTGITTRATLQAGIRHVMARR